VHQILDGLELPAASRFRHDGPPSGFAAKKTAKAPALVVPYMNSPRRCQHGNNSCNQLVATSCEEDGF
jgi:hypothetical protein